MVRALGALEEGRAAYAGRRWRESRDLLEDADRVRPLDAPDLELLAVAAYMSGCDEAYAVALERAHRAYLDSGRPLPAARCAWWIGHSLLFRAQPGLARGWFARGRRLLQGQERECVERGYVLLADLVERALGGDHDGAFAAGAEIAGIGERFADRDLTALAVMEQGHALVRQRRVAEGLRLVDETMVAVTTDEVSPLVAGIVLCNTIGFCQNVYELRRAREWTAALARWCAEQPDMVAHQGVCLVHRAEVMASAGDWPQALGELERISDRFTDGVLNQRALGRAAYCRGEIHRLRGEAGAAETAYRDASRSGREPQPGLALLRLAEGRAEAAFGTIRRAVAEVADPLGRAALLPAYAEIALAAGDHEAARSACRELDGIATRQGAEVLVAMAAQARGQVALTEGDPAAALGDLRRAWHLWEDLGSAYEAARARVLIAAACRALGDHDTARLDLESARAAFERLGAVPALTWVDSFGPGDPPIGDHGLTARELQVLRLAAAGRSNREIATELVISERTVARHLQNIFAKLRVSSRTAATAYAYEHDLV